MSAFIYSPCRPTTSARHCNAGVRSARGRQSHPIDDSSSAARSFTIKAMN